MPVGPLMKVPEPVGEDVEEYGADCVLWDISNPRSLINIVPDELKKVLLTLDSKLKYMSEVELHRLGGIDEVDGRIRLNFWDEYNLAQKRKRDIRITNVVRNVCPVDYWYEKILTSKEKVAYICIPPKDYIIFTRSLHEKGMERIQEFLSLPVTNAKGVVNTRLVGEIIKIVQMLDTRVMGAIEQRHKVEQRNLNLNFDANSGQIVGNAAATTGRLGTIEEVEHRIAEVKKQMLELGTDDTSDAIIVEAIGSETKES